MLSWPFGNIFDQLFGVLFAKLGGRYGDVWHPPPKKNMNHPDWQGNQNAKNFNKIK
jgi:hypothetical protein